MHGAVERALASHRCGSGSIFGLDAICGLSLLLVVFLAPRGFSPGTPVFPSPQKQTFPNSNSIPGLVYVSKVPKTFRARKANRKPATCFFCKAGFFICCKGNKN